MPEDTMYCNLHDNLIWSLQLLTQLKQLHNCMPMIDRWMEKDG